MVRMGISTKSMKNSPEYIPDMSVEPYCRLETLNKIPEPAKKAVRKIYPIRESK